MNEYEWAFSGRIQLEGQRPTDKSAMRGSFAACFSNSGRYLAVATQYGVISIFLTELLSSDDVDPLIARFTTSRPNSEPGAVRAMEFSPNPFDLLAWTEANGRIGVADVRDVFVSRQIIDIDSRGDGVERVWVVERSNDPSTPEASLDARLRAFRAESPSDASASTIPDYLGLDFDRQQLRDLTRIVTERHQLPPTADEMDILQAHRMARRQRDAAREVERYGPFSRLAEPSATSGDSSSMPSGLREFVTTDRNPSAFREFADRYNADRDRRRAENEVRRQDSSVLGDSTLDGESGGNMRTSADTLSGLERLLIAPRLSAMDSETAPNVWAELEDTYRTSRFPRNSQSTLQAEDTNEERQAFAQRVRQPWRPLDALTRLSLDVRNDNINILRRDRVREGRNEPVDTMGLAWSEDSKLLYVPFLYPSFTTLTFCRYVGAGDGIHEYQVNVAGRKIFPHRVLQ